MEAVVEGKVFWIGLSKGGAGLQAAASPWGWGFRQNGVSQSATQSGACSLQTGAPEAQGGTSAS